MGTCNGKGTQTPYYIHLTIWMFMSRGKHPIQQNRASFIENKDPSHLQFFIFLQLPKLLATAINIQ